MTWPNGQELSGVAAAEETMCQEPTAATSDSNDRLGECRKLATRLQNAAYSHGITDADDRWSVKKYRDAADKADNARIALLAEIERLIDA